MRFHRRLRRRVRALNRFSAPEFVSTESLGGIVLLAAALAALIWANVASSSYAEIWDTELTLGIGGFDLHETLRDWVNDGLMTVFFFVVGLEIKRELVCGELRDPRAASLPLVAALGGMIVPAALYLSLNAGDEGSRGWGIPIATDIAFAVAVLALFTNRIPRSLRLFVLALAIVDDIGAIIVIALFYTDQVTIAWLLGALAVSAAIVLVRNLGVAHPLAYVVPAIVLWICVLESGIHATIAGVALGLLTPARPPTGPQTIEGLEHRLHPWSSFVVVPIFALANAGVALNASVLQDAATSTIAWGIVVGLTLGKPAGIVIAAVIAVRTGLARAPAGLDRRHLLGAGALAGIGFTVSLFVADLSFTGIRLDEAKIGILAASLLSGVIGTCVLLRRTPRMPRDAPRDHQSVQSRS